VLNIISVAMAEKVRNKFNSFTAITAKLVVDEQWQF